MGTINFKIHGTYPPFAVELREGSEIGPVVDSMVAQSADTPYSFTNISGAGNFYVVAYDNAFGVSSQSTGVTTTTTTLPPTTTTTLPPTTTTTLPPTTTQPPDILYWGVAPLLEPDINDSNTNAIYSENQTLRMWFATDTGYTSGGGTGLALQNDIEFILFFNSNSGDDGTFTATTVNSVSGISAGFGGSINGTIQTPNLYLSGGTKQAFIDFEYNVDTGPSGFMVFSNAIHTFSQVLGTIPLNTDAGTTYGITSISTDNSGGIWRVNNT